LNIYISAIAEQFITYTENIDSEREKERESALIAVSFFHFPLSSVQSYSGDTAIDCNDPRIHFTARDKQVDRQFYTRRA